MNHRYVAAISNVRKGKIMRTSILVSVILMLILIPGGFAAGKTSVPDDFFKSGSRKAREDMRKVLQGKRISISAIQQITTVRHMTFWQLSPLRM